jgi:putative endonuclease
MAKHTELGQLGEVEAQRYLVEKGYRLLDLNWRFGHEEVDIIAMNSKILVFAEVKTRTNNAFGEPQEFVSKAKQRHLIRAANAYVERKDLFNEIRFDIIAVTLQPQKRIEHIKEAFYP